MKFAAILSYVFSAATFVAVAQDATTISANATLKDGSTFKGEFTTKSITGSTLFMEKLELDPALVKTVTFVNTNGESKIELKNGDRFAMTVANDAFAIKSLLGELNIPRTNFRSITLSSRRISAGGCNDGLIFYCTFDDENSIIAPAVGPKGTFFHGDFRQGKVGKALQTTVYSNNASFELPADFFNTEGCIEFWAKILNQSSYIGSGGDPRLFSLTQKFTHATFSGIDIVSNNGGGNSGFSTWTLLGNMANFRGCRSLRYEDLFPYSDYRDWHHYAVIWNKDGITSLPGNPRMALVVDGKHIPDIQNHVRNDEDVSSIISGPTFLSFTHDPASADEHSTKSPFLIDEFKIWNYAKTDFNF